MSPWDDSITAGDLKRALADVPDDTRVAFHSPGYYEFVGEVSIEESISRDHDVLELRSPGGIE